MRETILSADRKYRYALWREWPAGDGRYVMFIGLNPSTADETNDDPTIRRCIRFAKDWGFSALCMVNLFAYRATDPQDMKIAFDPIGPENDQWLSTLARDAGNVIAAWGADGKFMSRDRQVEKFISPMLCLGKTKFGHPRHPLYIKADAELILYSNKVLDSSQTPEYNSNSIAKESSMSKCSICNEPQFRSLLGMNCQNGHLNAPAQESVTLSGTQTHDNKPVTDEQVRLARLTVGEDLGHEETKQVVAASSEVIPLDKLVKIYVKMRDKLGEEKKAFEVIEKDLKEQMAQVATELKARAIQQGVGGFKTDFGTVYLSESMKVSCGDWSAFGEFLKDHDPLEFMEKRISSTAVKEYMKHTDGQLPPGVSIFKEIEARVRRAGEK